MKINEDNNAKVQIMERVQRESDAAWGRRPSYHTIPKYEKPKIKKNAIGWVVFFKNVFIDQLRQLKP